MKTAIAFLALFVIQPPASENPSPATETPMPSRAPARIDMSCQLDDEDYEPAAIVGAWESLDRHVAMGSLFQPVHGVRKREALVFFEQDGERLTGHCVMADHAAITHQERWTEGRTDFRLVELVDDRLAFEFDIDEWRIDAGPLAVEERRIENKGSVRVEARLEGDRLVGVWKMFLVDGTEVFRGEWEAARAELPDTQDAVEQVGPVLLIGGRHQDLPEAIRDRFFELAGGKQARIVVIPVLTAGADDPEDLEAILKTWRDLGPASVVALHTRNRTVADDPAFVGPLANATAVFFTNGHLHRYFDAYGGTLVEQELKEMHARGVLIGGAGTGMVLVGEVIGDHPDADRPTVPGVGFLPGFLIDDDGDEEGYAEAVAAHPAHVGLLIDDATAVQIRGDTLRILGEGTVTLRLAAGAGLPAKSETLRSGAMLNVDELRRGAAERAR